MVIPNTALRNLPCKHLSHKTGDWRGQWSLHPLKILPHTLPVTVCTDILQYLPFIHESALWELRTHQDGRFFTWIHTDSFGTRHSVQNLLKPLAPSLAGTTTAQTCNTLANKNCCSEIQSSNMQQGNDESGTWGERINGISKDIHLQGLTRNRKTCQDDQFPIEFRTGNLCNTNQTN
jgi:hypothetical protein